MKASAVVVAAFLFSQPAFSETNPGDVTSLALAALRKGDTAAVSDLFHIPGNLTVAEVKKEKDGIAQIIDVLLLRFGSIESFSLIDDGPYVYEIGVFGGDVGLWRAMSREGRDVQRDYKVKFSLVGDGYLRFGLFRSTRGLCIRGIQFALPTHPAKNKKVIESIGIDVMLEMGESISSGQTGIEIVE